MLLILKGIPASGKSTFAKQWIKEAPNRARVCRDDIRMQVFGVEFGCDEDVITELEYAMIKSLSYDNYDIVVDATNINPLYFQRMKNYATYLLGIHNIQVKTFEIPLEIALERNRIRKDNGGRFVPEDVIVRMYNQL